MKMKAATFTVMALSLAACAGDMSSPAGQPSYGGASDLSAFQGARAGQAEMGIQNLGYELIRTDGLRQYWFNRASGACAELTVGDGRYQNVRMLPAEDC